MEECVATTLRFQKLTDLSVKDKFCPVTDLDWTDIPRKDVPWMPFELCSLFGTPYWNNLSPNQMLTLSQLEMINLFSMTLRGEKEIQADLLEYLYLPEFADDSDYLSILLGEESDHILMFGKFCRMHFGRVIQYKHVRLTQFADKKIATLNAFLQTLVAEEILTFYNVEIAKFVDAPNLVRKINERHYKDESRHIAMGRQVVRSLWSKLEADLSSEMLQNYRIYVGRFIRFFIADLANVEIYKIIGLANPLKVKIAVEREKFSNLDTFKPAAKIQKYLLSVGIA
ncbi:MAG: diiron oxygenase [Burkholderiaceae bacterium]|nr:diiron oxygenase [Burkholderiaceae bacterium]